MAVESTFGPNSLWRTIMDENILPGHAPSYELCKLLYTSHPLGGKIAHMPVEMALGEARTIRVDSAPDDEAAKEFLHHWAYNGCDDVIAKIGTKARIYGLAAMVFGAVDPATGKPIPTDEPVPFNRLHELDIYFNVVDPLNTAGSVTLNQDPNDPDFLKAAASLAVNGRPYCKGRFVALMNEGPEYLDYEGSAYGYSGRSSFRRCVYPLRSYLETQVANNQVAHKAGVIIAKIKQASSTANQMMKVFSSRKAETLKFSSNENVITIDKDEEITSLNLQNVDGSLHGVRQSILEDIAAAATMPAQILKAETLAQGFGEGTEDAKQIAQYVARMRRWLKPVYDFCDAVTMRRAWNPAFIRTMKEKNPEEYGNKSEETIFREWQASFVAQWPSENNDAEQSDAIEKNYRILLDTARILMPMVQNYPDGMAELLEFMQTNINNTDNQLFAGELNIDTDAIRAMPPGSFNVESGEPKEPDRPAGI